MVRNPFSRREPAAEPTVPAGTAVYAIGDIHGRVDLLAGLFARLAADADQGGAGRRVLVCLGDYVDRGDDSAGVIELILDRSPPGFEVVTLLGNHERLMIEFLDDVRRAPLWLRNGGDATLESYGIEVTQGAYLDAKPLLALQAALRERLPVRHLEFLQSLKLAHAEGDYVFVHAGVRPGVPLEAQQEEDLIWIRELFLNSTADHGAVIVHGHTIRPEPEFRPNRIGIDTGAYFTNNLTCLALEGTKRRIISTAS
ncbi:MAG: serine/threonine protein phosphatase [Alphaproteobacteria bacterium]|nr:serine/threonine protein phosphatase [Alphaproteobacteria bacterium]